MVLARGLASTALLLWTAVATAEEPHYALDTTRSSAELTVGEKGVLSIVIKPAPGRKVHDQAPLSISLKAPKGLTLAKAKLGQADVVNKGQAAPEFSVEITATAAGPQATEADLQFFICTEKWCERQQQRITVSTVVK
ncbi:MAG: hypothetical protein HY904_09005 [Deltaproteobacteria bacterium]|nr:hypothetical protein [Deltaproteobacteria bacterium]